MPENFAVNKGLKINGDYRGDKHTIWDGGFRVPMIINHPNKIKKNTTSDAVVSTVDVYAFLADYIGKGEGVTASDAIDSSSFINVINNKKSNYTRSPLIQRDARGRNPLEQTNGNTLKLKLQMRRKRKTKLNFTISSKTNLKQLT